MNVESSGQGDEVRLKQDNGVRSSCLVYRESFVIYSSTSLMLESNVVLFEGEQWGISAEIGM